MKPIDEQTVLLFHDAAKRAASPVAYVEPFALSDDEAAGAWARWFARSFDVWWQTALVAGVLGYILGQSSPAFLRWLETPFGWKLFGLACIPGALLVDAALHALAGNTPGKALLGLHLVGVDRRAPGLRELVGRNLRLWRSGLALGLPAISLLAMARQGLRLRKGLQASYDRNAFLVRARPVGRLAKGVFAMAFTGMLAAIIAFDAIDRQDSQQAAAMLEAPPYAWDNPVTGRAAPVSAQWKHEMRAGPDGAPQHLFTQHSGQAVVLFAHDRVRGSALRQDAAALEERLADRFELTESYFADFRGRHSWVGRGQHKKGPEWVQLRIVEVDGKAWRLVAMQSPPAAYTDDLVRELSGALWDTVLRPVPQTGPAPSP
ncbi:RDD family protein [Massilia sp. UMI-21]|nr:RDD family protein [Massilia sp. UMI-21]